VVLALLCFRARRAKIQELAIQLFSRRTVTLSMRFCLLLMPA
jgi:hypothetical protein